MIYLLEGCDRTGKSTLANDPRFDDFEKYHFGAFPTPIAAFNAYYALLLGFVESKISGKERNAVIDRMHISERVYGKYYHNKWMTDERYELIEMLCKYLDVQVIHCNVPWRSVLDGWKANLDNEMIKDEKKLQDIYITYCDIASYTRLPIQTYDYTVAGALNELRTSK